jgi:hypothetical protein
MEGYRIGEFGEKQMKGINLAVKALAKKFPFVTGWELSDNWDIHFNIININLIVDLEKVREYYNVEISDYWIVIMLISHLKIYIIQFKFVVNKNLF